MLTDSDLYCRAVISELQAQLAHKKKKLITMKQENTRLLDQLEIAFKKQSEQADELKTLRYKFSAIEKHHFNLKTQNDGLKKETNNMYEQLEELQKYEKKDKFKKYEKIISQLQADIQKLANCIEEHKFVRQLNSEELRKQANEISQLKSALGQQEGESQPEQRDEQQYQIQLDLVNIALQQNQSQLQKVKSAFKTYIQKTAKHCLNIYEECLINLRNPDKLQETIKKLKLNKADQNIDLTLIDEELNKEEAEDLNKELQNLKKENIKQQQIIREQASQIKNEKDLLEQIERLERSNEHYKDQQILKQRTFMEQLTGLKRANKQISDDYDRVQKQMNEMMIENEALQDTVTRQEKKIQTLQLNMYKS